MLAPGLPDLVGTSHHRRKVLGQHRLRLASLALASAVTALTVPGTARAAPGVTQLGDTQLDAAALYFVSFDGLVNNASYQRGVATRPDADCQRVRRLLGPSGRTARGPTSCRQLACESSGMRHMLRAT
jgi:hypothetical protein